tara:strand:+ start:2222 stop:2410 length:189 start_codon:yes stop_codon:yes gene_type:complete
MENSYKIGDRVTAKTVNSDGDTVFISGNIRAITDKQVFIENRFPKIEHFSVKVEDIIVKQNK